MNWERANTNFKDHRGEPSGYRIGASSRHCDHQLHWQIQELYGVSKEEAERQLRYWESSLD